MGDCLDFDAALEAAEPIAFKFMGEMWELPPADTFDFRDFARHIARLNTVREDDEKYGAEILEWLGGNCQDPARFSALAENRKIPLRQLAHMREKIVERMLGMKWEVGDLEDPLGRSSVSSVTLNGNGPPSAGGSRRSASKTR